MKHINIEILGKDLECFSVNYKNLKEEDFIDSLIYLLKSREDVYNLYLDFDKNQAGQASIIYTKNQAVKTKKALRKIMKTQEGLFGRLLMDFIESADHCDGTKELLINIKYDDNN